MSKTSLKKELMTMGRDQLVEIILDVYAARPEAKEYFEFFLNPDVEKLMEKEVKEVAKECQRHKRGSYSTFRISRIKKIDKNFMSFQPGEDYVMDFKMKVLAILCSMSGIYYLNETHIRSIVVYMESILEYSDKAGLMARFMIHIGNMMKDFDGSRSLKREMLSKLKERGLIIEIV